MHDNRSGFCRKDKNTALLCLKRPAEPLAEARPVPLLACWLSERCLAPAGSDFFFWASGLCVSYLACRTGWLIAQGVYLLCLQIIMVQSNGGSSKPGSTPDNARARKRPPRRHRPMKATVTNSPQKTHHENI
jgi:hypothetical protein